ncbi:sensor histidine kinase [Spongorhabdus nitratireducens]
MVQLQRFWSRLSVSRKLGFILTSVVLLLALFAGTLLVTAATALSRDVYLPSNLQAIHNLLTTPAVTRALMENPDSAKETLRAATRYPLVAVIGLYRPDGSLYAGFSHSSEDAVPDRLTHARQQQPLNDALLEPVNMLSGTQPWHLYISAVSTLPPVFYQRMILATLLLFGCFIGLVLLSMQLTRRNITRPVQHLIKTARRIPKEGCYAQRAKISSEDELGDLCRSFNHMLDHIQARDRQLTSIKAYLNAIIDSMPSAIVAVDKDYNITRWNREAAAMTNTPRHQALQKPLQDMLTFIEPCMPAIAEAFSDHAIHQEQKVAATLQGNATYLDITIYPMSGPAGDDVVIRIDDVTRRLKMEEIMVQSEKMMSVGGLAAGMAHEINNPLGAIIQGIQTVQRRLSLDLEANREVADALELDLQTVNQYLQQRGITRFIGNIQDAGIRASSIVSNMLQFSRSSDRRLQPCNLTELVERTIEIASTDFELRPELDFHQLKITCDLDTTLPPIYCIQAEIQQVLLNLLKNAAQAIQQRSGTETDIAYQGLITITTRKIGERVMISVEDNGAGMSEDIKKRIFEPFYTTKDVGMGTGLGLSVSYFIITNNHKGSMFVSSQSGQGSCFTLKLPMGTTAAPSRL